MDTSSILAKTAKGIAAKPEEQGLNYDGVRLLRLINGKASIGELRTNFTDLADARFEKAIVTLQRNGLVRVLEVTVPAPAPQAEAPGLDAQMHEVERQVLQTLDFSGLQRTLLDAMRASPAISDAPAAAASPVPAAVSQPAGETREFPPAEAKARSPHKQRPTHEAELRAQLIAALRPKVEEELRSTLASALRPALEAEIRSKLVAALKPRVELELRTRLKAQLEQAAAAATMSPQRVFECLPIGAFQNDLSGKNACVNPAWAELTGTGVSDTVGRPFAELFLAEDRKGIALYLDRIARGREAPSWFEASLERKAGGPLRIRLRAAPLTNAAGETIGVCGMLLAPGAVPEQ